MYQFEISRGGLVAVGLAICTGMLWMFIFGIYIGRDVFDTSDLAFNMGLSAVPGNGEKAESHSVPVPVSKQETGTAGQEEKPSPDDSVQNPEAEKQTDGAEVEKEKQPSYKTLYTLQIASLRDAAKASELESTWEKKGYDVYIVSNDSPGKGVLYRVQIGRFNTAEEANTAMVKIAETEKTKLYITTHSIPLPSNTAGAGE